MKEPPPYYVPVFTDACPQWIWEVVLVGYEAIPDYPVKSWREVRGWNDSLLMTESGGLAKIRPSDEYECLYKQMNIFPDIVFTLDFPTKMKRPQLKGDSLAKRMEEWKFPEPVKIRRVKKTVESAKIAMKMKPEIESLFEHEFELFGVIQGYDLNSIIYCTEEIYSLGYEFFGAGVVPTDPAFRGTTATSMLAIIRDIIGRKSWLHLLGVTDENILLRTKGLYDSFDSAYVSIQAKNAQLVHPDGTTSYIGRKIDERRKGSLKWFEFSPVHKEDYFILQEVNFVNYVTNLYRLGIITHGKEYHKKAEERVKKKIEERRRNNKAPFSTLESLDLGQIQ